MSVLCAKVDYLLGVLRDLSGVEWVAEYWADFNTCSFKCRGFVTIIFENDCVRLIGRPAIYGFCFKLDFCDDVGVRDIIWSIVKEPEW